MERPPAGQAGSGSEHPQESFRSFGRFFPYGFTHLICASEAETDRNIGDTKFANFV